MSPQSAVPPCSGDAQVVQQNISRVARVGLEGGIAQQGGAVIQAQEGVLSAGNQLQDKVQGLLLIGGKGFDELAVIPVRISGSFMPLNSMGSPSRRVKDRLANFPPPW